MNLEKLKELQVQRIELNRKIRVLQTMEEMHNCNRIRFSVLVSSGAWSDELELTVSETRKLKTAILKILGEENGKLNGS